MMEETNTINEVQQAIQVGEPVQPIQVSSDTDLVIENHVLAEKVKYLEKCFDDLGACISKLKRWEAKYIKGLKAFDN